jgi:transcription initiation factor IIE alpha subunit
MLVNPLFYINFARYKKYTEKSTDWFIRSWKFKYNSLEWQICRLKSELYERKADKCLKTANRNLQLWEI